MFNVLYCIILHFITLNNTMLHYIFFVLHNIKLFSVIVYYSILYYITLYYTTLSHIVDR